MPRGRGRGRPRNPIPAKCAGANADSSPDGLATSPVSKKRTRADNDGTDFTGDTISVGVPPPNASRASGSGNGGPSGMEGEHDKMDIDTVQAGDVNAEKSVNKGDTLQDGLVPDSAQKPRRGGRQRKSSVAMQNTDENDSFVIPAETRRSSRRTQAPRDDYTAALEKESSKPKPKPATRGGRGGGRGGGRMKKADKMWTEEYLLTNPESAFATCDPRNIVTKEMWDLLDADEKEDCMKLVYESDKVYPTADPSAVDKPDTAKPDLRQDFWQDPSVKEGFRSFQDNLTNGRYDPRFVAAAADARKRRMAGEFDSFKDQQFEEYWGQKQKLAYDSLAGDQSKIKIETLVKHKWLRENDVFSLRRSFQGGPTIAKEAKLTKVDPEDHSMTFCFPPKDRQYVDAADPDNVVIEGVVSMQALETRLLKEHSHCPLKIPNGNSWKTFRIIRNQEDIGALFEVRADFYTKFLAPKEEE